MTDDPDDAEVSKSARKRAAHAAQDLGARLIALPEAELTNLGLPDLLVAALLEARRLRSRAALARQRQYIGKLMRPLDPEPIETALAARNAVSRADADRLKQIERWRNRLIAEGATGVAALAERYPGLDHARLAALIDSAGSEHLAPAARSAAFRSLFRELRTLLASD